MRAFCEKVKTSAQEAGLPAAVQKSEPELQLRFSERNKIGPERVVESTEVFLRYVRKDVTTPNIIGSCCVCVGSGVQMDVTTPHNVVTCSASWEGYNPQNHE